MRAITCTWGRNTYGLKTWDTVFAVRGEGGLRIRAMPGKHAFGLMGALLPPVIGSLLEFEAGDGIRVRIYISGDTLVTMEGRQGVEALRILRPRKAVPIHFNDYPVFKSPLEDFRKAVDEAGLGDKVVYLHHGETYTFEVPVPAHSG